MPRSPTWVCSLVLGPRTLREHLGHRLLHRLLVLVAVIAQCALADPAPYQRLLRCAVEADHQCPFDILLRSDSAHASADSAHTPGAIGGLLLQAAAHGHDQVRVGAQLDLA